jgi:hypothetical protein
VPHYQTGAQLLGEGFGDDEDEMLAAAILASMETMKLENEANKNEDEPINEQ